MALWMSLGGFALLDTLSPTIIGVTIYLILADRNNRIVRLGAYLLTVVILYFLLGVMLMFGFDYIVGAFASFFQSQFFRWVLFIIGVGLFIGAYYVPAKKNALPTPQTQGLLSMVLVGIMTFFMEAGTAFPYFAAIGLVATMDISLLYRLLIIAAYNLIMIAPALLLFAGYSFMGKYMHTALVKSWDKLSTSTHSTLSWMMCIVGVIIVLYAIDGLTITIP